MEKVVYILGAGFSAPLGLPVMSNFILKAKDIYFENAQEYTHFNEIFELLNRMSTIKNYFRADLYNIEEILSILEMNDYLSGERNTEKFKRFLKDVIEISTPEINKYQGQLPSNWYDFVFGNDNLDRMYGHFVAELFNLEFSRTNDHFNSIDVKRNKKVNTNYSVITLNYDLVLENIIRHINRTYEVSLAINFTDNSLLEIETFMPVFLSKLHGCVEKMNIVPPTWNKTSNEDLLDTWKLAQKLLREANHVRILGYSLPISDSYMKYMLKSSIMESKHLKSLDVISLDPYHDVKARYDDFIDFKYYRFKNAKIEDYLTELMVKTKNYTNNNRHGQPITHNFLEKTHDAFMES